MNRERTTSTSARPEYCNALLSGTYHNTMNALEITTNVWSAAPSLSFTGIMVNTGTSTTQSRYRWLADELRSRIDAGAILDNDALPSERDLSIRYDVSRDTVRKAVRYLEERGVLYSDHGRGTFVAPALVRNMSRYLDSFSDDTAARGGKAGQQILSVEPTGASLAMAGLLAVQPGDPLIRVQRIRTINGQPVGLHDAYVVAAPGLRIDASTLERAGSLYKLLRETAGLTLAEAVENLSAGAATEQDAKLLAVSKGSPLLICERITLSERREPVEYCQMKYLPTYRYSTRLHGHGLGT